MSNGYPIYGQVNDASPSTTATLVFYATSPAHAAALSELRAEMPTWTFLVIYHEGLNIVAPGIVKAFLAMNFSVLSIRSLEELSNLSLPLPCVVAFGAIFEPFALSLFAWAKRQQIPVVGFEEVAQLSLNNLDINNYDAPFDKLFVASPAEYQLFSKLGYPSSMLEISGLLSKRKSPYPLDKSAAKKQLSLAVTRPLILYTTSPLRTRRAIHNKDDRQTREQILFQIQRAARELNAAIVVKLHPNERLNQEVRQIHKICPSAAVFDRSPDVASLFAAADVVVNRGNSQTALDSALLGIPTVVASLGLPTLFESISWPWIAESSGDISRKIIAAVKSTACDFERLPGASFVLPPEGAARFIAESLELCIQTRGVEKFDMWIWLIKSILFMGGHEEALTLCRALSPTSNEFFLIGNALQAHKAGNYTDAIAWWEKVSLNDPGWFFPLHEMAFESVAIGEHRVAIDFARSARRLLPRFHRYWHDIPLSIIIARSLRERGEISLALDAFSELDAGGISDVMPEILIEKSRIFAVNESFKVSASLAVTAIQTVLLSPIGTEPDKEIYEACMGCLYDTKALVSRRQGLATYILVRIAVAIGKCRIMHGKNIVDYLMRIL